jgi:hypothetical protein
MIQRISSNKKMFAVLSLVLLAVAAATGQVGNVKACGDYGGCGLGFFHHWRYFHFYHWGFIGGGDGCCNDNIGCCESLQGQGVTGPVFQSAYNPYNQYQQYQPQSQGQGQTSDINVEGNNNYVNVEQGQHQEQGQSFGSPLDNQCWQGDDWGQCGGDRGDGGP